MVFTVAIPWLTGRAIDQVRAGDEDELQHARRSAIVGAGAAAPAASPSPGGSSPGGSRSASRSTCASACTRTCSRSSSRFFDRQQTGQLMSRATVDLQSVRFFLGYGLIFMLQSALTIVLAAVAMIIIDPGLALIALIPVPFVVLVAARYGRALAARAPGGPAADRRADRRGRGEHLRRARRQGVRARGRASTRASSASVARVFDQSMISTRLRAFYNAVHRLPPPARARGAAVRRRAAGHRRHRSRSASSPPSTRYLLMLLGPMRTLGMSLGMAQRATASGARVFELLDREPRIVAPRRTPRPLPEGSGPRRAARRHAASTRARRAGAARRHRSTSRAGTTVALVGATGSGKTTLVQLLPRLYDPTRGRGADRRRRRARRSTSSRCAARSPSSTTTRSCSAPPSHENIAYAREDASREEVDRRGAARAGARRSSSACPTATTRASASAA